MFAENAALEDLTFLHCLPLLPQNLYHTFLLFVLNCKHLLKRYQVFVLLLGKVDLETGQLNEKQFLLWLLFALVS